MSNDQSCTKPSFRYSESPSCWICLEEGPDDSGKPLVRDCACRGNAGFTHVYCIVEYAQAKSVDVLSSVLASHKEQAAADFTAPWEKCPQCQQRYQHKLAIDLAQYLLGFIDEKFPHNMEAECLRYCALRVKANAIRSMDCRYNPVYIPEGKQTAYKILSIAEKMKIYNREWGIQAEAVAHEQLGYLYGGADGQYKEGIKHYKKARVIWMLLGENDRAKVMESQIESVKSTKAIDEGRPGKAALEITRDSYDALLRLEGESSVQTIQAGMNLALAFYLSMHGIECERLIRKIADTSIRMFGAEHDITIHAFTRLELFKIRCVEVISQPTARFIALRYDARSDQYVLMADLRRVGDLSLPQDTDNCDTISVNTDDVLFKGGTPVVCHSLKNASHLNGKIGDARRYNHSDDRYEVYF